MCRTHIEHTVLNVALTPRLEYLHLILQWLRCSRCSLSQALGRPCIQSRRRLGQVGVPAVHEPPGAYSPQSMRCAHPAGKLQSIAGRCFYIFSP